LNNTNAQEIFATAGQFYSQKQYEFAALEYERTIFLSSDKEIKQTALFKKSECQKLNGDYINELRTLSRLDVSLLPDTLRYQYYYERALAYYLTDEFEQAENELTQLNFFIKDSLLANESLILQILVLNELNEWEQAKIFYRNFLAMHQLTYDSLPAYHFLDESVFKSRSKAKWVSAIVPGVGQVYAGKFWRGLSNNLMFDGALAYTVLSTLDKYYFSAALTGAALVFRFYTGGIRYSALLADKRNREKSRAINDSIKAIILTLH
jgi:tetratricopeptide (TPR) repeat protein